MDLTERGRDCRGRSSAGRCSAVLSSGEQQTAGILADLTPALERGLAESRKATPMSLDEFLERVANREGVERDEAEHHSRAVFAALREVVSAKEIHDVESELPADYAPLFSGVL